MRKIKFFITIIFISTNSTGQIMNPNDLADKIIYGFQTRNFENFKNLLLNTADYKEFLNDFLKNNNIPGSERKEFAKKEKLFADSADILHRQKFERLLNKGVKLNIDWTSINKAGFVFKEVKPEDSDKKSLSGHLNFTCKDTTFVIFGIEAIELSSGYKISHIRTILKGGVPNYVEPDLLDNEDL